MTGMEKDFVREKISRLQMHREKVQEFQQQLALQLRGKTKNSARLKLLEQNQAKTKKQLAMIEKNITILEKYLKKSKARA